MRSALALAIMVATGGAAAAGDTGPSIVVPSRPGVPVIVDGLDIAYAVVEGDWGLGKSIHVTPTVYWSNWRGSYKPPAGHYYPHTGQMPGYGRLEIDTPSRNPGPESYFRSWSAESQPTPPTVGVPFDPPPIILAPRGHRNAPRGDHHPTLPMKKEPGEPTEHPAQEPR